MSNPMCIKTFSDDTRRLEVCRHLSGGVLIRFGREEIVLSPKDAVDFCTAVLAGVNIDFRMELPPAGLNHSMQRN